MGGWGVRGVVSVARWVGGVVRLELPPRLGWVGGSRQPRRERWGHGASVPVEAYISVPADSPGGLLLAIVATQP